jgi:hypothetical protein
MMPRNPRSQFLFRENGDGQKDGRAKRFNKSHARQYDKLSVNQSPADAQRCDGLLVKNGDRIAIS